jgi:uncharacterized protein YdcH (DUF465 family)
MTNLLEIEAAIKQLPENEVRQLATWLQNYLNEKWDRQIESDLASGKLDDLIAKAEADIAANNVKEVNEVKKLRGILKDKNPDRKLVDELIQERREEAASE